MPPRSSLLRVHPAGEVPLNRHFQVRAELRVEVSFQASPAEHRGNTLHQPMTKFVHP